MNVDLHVYPQGHIKHRMLLEIEYCVYVSQRTCYNFSINALYNDEIMISGKQFTIKKNNNLRCR